MMVPHNAQAERPASTGARMKQPAYPPVRSNLLLARKPVVVSVVADPKPENATLHVNAEGPMMDPDSA